MIAGLHAEFEHYDITFSHRRETLRKRLTSQSTDPEKNTNLSPSFKVTGESDSKSEGGFVVKSKEPKKDFTSTPPIFKSGSSGYAKVSKGLPFSSMPPQRRRERLWHCSGVAFVETVIEGTFFKREEVGWRRGDIDVGCVKVGVE